jgi:hypothetical protein
MRRQRCGLRSAAHHGAQAGCRRAGTTIPDGTVLTVRMIDSIDSDVAAVGDRFRASLDEALVVNGRQVAPRRRCDVCN